ncbi:arsenate reductase family protein [Paracoccus aestuariivivens]|uniref:Arsenate reductase n=1 Tax=Paracoccus aestuariivivens TaxID=1820333 RepID=A0A6L6J6Q5_9RHOB|nr:arsenate reductase family protein [Paracoccus aestuariivivens]MTH77630.1 arsenate reductase (glutaredoxin) [Paracoccus aestuariivivens]
MITIYHKPTCSTSRKVLQMIRDAGFEPQVIDYVKTGWSRDELQDLLAAANVTPAQALRVKGTDAAERGLVGADDKTILDQMLENPALVERPIVSGPGGVRLCRPAELVAQTFAR